MNTDIQQFINLVHKVLAQSDNCADSNAMLDKCENYDQVRRFWEYYINGIINEVPEQVLQTFADYWNEYGDNLRKAGIYFNEDCAKWDLCIIGNTDKEVHLRYRCKAYVLGKATVVAHDRAQVFSFCDDAHIILKDSSFGNIRKGTYEKYNFATVIEGEN